jgi:DNA replication and repair protein RecF
MLKSLRLDNFRNHKNFNCEFENINYISGNNGTGKTSILEAINLVFQGKSFKNISINKLLNFDSSYFRVETLVDQPFESELIFFYDSKNSNKSLIIDKKKVSQISNHILNFPTFVYSPENEGLLSNNQIYRRNFLDKITFFYFNEHLQNLRILNKLLKIKKNIFTSNKIDLDYLKTINDMLLEVSIDIQNKRKLILEKINKNILATLNDIKYIENFMLKLIYSEINSDDFQKEINYKKILKGPHLDKIKYFFNGIEYEKFSSFGQRKSFSLICLNACFLTVEEKLKNDIIFLLDDFEAGLDDMRIDFFKNLFSKHQLIMTGVSNTHFKKLNTISL